MCGLVLPQKTDDQTDDEFEDAAINRLIEEALQDVEFNGHPVISVPVPCNSSEVVINGKVRTQFSVMYLLLIKHFSGPQQRHILTGGGEHCAENYVIKSNVIFDR